MIIFNNYRYKSTAAGKNLDQILQKAIQHATLLKQSPSSSINESLSPIPFHNPKQNGSSPSFLPTAKRVKSLIQPLNLSVTTTIEDDSGTASISPTNSVSNDVICSSSMNDLFSKQIPTSIWDESVNDILLTVAKQRDTRTVKITTLRTYLEEKLGFVEFLCLYRGFKSEPKVTFQGTPWEHYQRFLPVLFTLLTLENMTV
jgi:hypothetical protein